MKTMGKRVIILLVALAATLLLMASTFAVDSDSNGTCGYGLTWMLDSDGTLTISGSGGMDNYCANDAPWQGETVKKVVISEGVTSIGAGAFRGCAELTAVTFAEGCGLTSIGQGTFSGCTSLMEIKIPASVTGIGENVFYGGASPTGLTVTGIAGAEGGAFYGCTSLAKVIFAEGSKLESVGRDTFYGCTSLAEITIPADVTSIGYEAFHSCTSLTEIEIPKGVTSIEWSTFYDCTNLKKVAFSADSNLASIGEWAFTRCSNLTEIMIPQSVINIGKFAFLLCRNITEIILPQGVTSIEEHAFYGCASLERITIPAGVIRIDCWAFSNCTSLTGITIPADVTSIGDYAFADCVELKDVYAYCDAPENGGTGECFSGCHEELTIHYCNTAEGWTSPTWNGIRTEAFSDPDDELLAESEFPIVGSRNTGSQLRETALGNLITDSMRWYTANKLNKEVDAALINGGMLRADIDAGKLSRKDVDRVLAFGNTAVIVEVTGAQLLTALEAACQYVPDGTTAFPQVSGMELLVTSDVAYQSTDELLCTIGDRSYYAPKNAGERMKILRIGERLFSAEETYHIVTNDYLANGGDAYAAFSKGEKIDTDCLVADMVAAYLKESLEGQMPRRYEQAEGRTAVAASGEVYIVPQEMRRQNGALWMAAYEESGRMCAFEPLERGYLYYKELPPVADSFRLFCIDEAFRPMCASQMVSLHDR